eukprot:201572_1
MSTISMNGTISIFEYKKDCNISSTQTLEKMYTTISTAKKHAQKLANCIGFCIENKTTPINGKEYLCHFKEGEKTDIQDGMRKWHTYLCSAIINTNIFENDDQNCNGYDDCSSITRLMTILLYYSKTYSQNPNEFIDFCDKYYAKSYLKDYIHFICIHKNDINKNETENETCRMVSTCSSTTRHYRDRTNEEMKTDENGETQQRLYVDIFDSIHFYMCHMAECGLRISINEDNIKDIVDDEYSNCQDEVIAFIQNEIERKQAKCGLFKRLDNTKNSKFNIMQISNINSGNEKIKIDWKKEMTQETTFTDQILECIASTGIKKSIVTDLREYLTCEEYDTDSIEFDFFYFGDDGNMVQNFGYGCSDSINNFITAKNVFSLSFSIGLKFDYWNHSDTQHSVTKNINDHSGYKASELIIKPKHLSFKQEIAEYSDISFGNYTKNVYVKALEYKNTLAVKGMQFVDNAAFKIYIDSPTEQHLISLILYTDFTKLSSKFTATFRKNGFFETIKSIKKRNSVYYWWSKYLRECIECFGESREGTYSYVLDKHINKLVG